ncbi:MAG: hypothetical protein OEU94_00050 [Aquincola sp.]|nr:hypothetical protein [Aquincola sp.]MDH4289735.1 hypothetical protein [Aquincola sp.]MDH5330296.1 hypothetical protein [Aquincola sp.]
MTNLCVKRLVVATVLAVAVLPVWAQAYRCTIGARIVFQQTPCTGGSKVASEPGPPSAAPAPSAGAALCERHARAAGTFNDPDSLRIGRIRYAGARKLVIHETTIAARTYSLVINARNAYGGYDGDAVYECQLSEDEGRVLKFVRAADQRQPPASER